MPANTYGRQVVIAAANKSGGALAAGDVCVVDTTNNLAFTTSTAGAVVNLIIAVAQETIANNATGRFLTSGYAALVNVNASVTRGNFGKTFTVAKQATDAGASRIAGTFCQFTTGGTAPDAIVYPSDLGGASLTNPMTTTGDMIYSSDNSGTPARRAIGSGGQGIITDGSTPAWAEILPWHIQFVPMIATPDATTGTWSIIQFSDSGLVYPFVYASLTGATAIAYYNSTSAQNDAFSYNVVLAKGTWDCNIWVRKSSNTGIITLNQDGSSQGTADTYAAAAAAASLSITGWTVATTGKHVMQFKAATKNASSSNYLLEIFGIEFRRTA